jgi:MFS family permease
LRTSAFWILAIITMLSAFSENGLVTNLASILTQHGVLAVTAALALSVRGGTGIIGRLGVGFAIDRVSPERIQCLVLALVVVGMLILAFAGSAWPVLLGGGDTRCRPGQRGRCRPLPTRALFRPQALLCAIRSYLDCVCHWRRYRPPLDWTPL